MNEQTDHIAQALRVPGAHLFIGRGGYTLHFAQGSRLSGYDPDRMKTECIARGLPVIDTRDIPLDILVVEVIRNPLVAVGEEASPEPRGSLDLAPLEEIARRYHDLGAEVRNIDLDVTPHR